MTATRIDVVARTLHETFLLDDRHSPNLKGYAHCDCREKAAAIVDALEEVGE